MAGVAVTLIVAGAAPQGHHSVAGQFDETRESIIDGVITEFRFINPHPFVVVLPVNGEQSWRFDFDNLSEFAAIGFTAGDLQVGDRVVVLGWLARREANRLYVMRLERPADGFGFEQIANHPQLFEPR